MGPPKAAPSTESPSHRRLVAEHGATDERRGLAEDGDRGASLEAVDSAVPLDLVEDLLGILLAVDSHEDILDHGLLVLGEALHLGLGDLPVVVHLEAQLVIKGEADHLVLLFIQGVVKGLHQGFGSALGLFFLGGEGGHKTGSPDSGGGTGGSAEEGAATGG